MVDIRETLLIQFFLTQTSYLTDNAKNHVIMAGHVLEEKNMIGASITIVNVFIVGYNQTLGQSCTKAHIGSLDTVIGFAA